VAFFEHDDVRIYYEVHGEGFPVLLIAPGGMQSAVSFWENAPWNPIEQLSEHFQVIAMDQRNAGQSSAPVAGSDSWHVYTEDQLSLLDHLGVEKFHVAGMCIGGSYIMGLIQAAPERVASAVVFQTIGLDNNRQAFYDMFDSWADKLKSERADVPESAWASFRESMYGGDFLFTVDRDFVRNCETPMLVLCGRDLYHPEVSSRELAELARNAELIEYWKEGDELLAAKEKVERFLVEQTPEVAA
jgi:pimeloyl-ACP methyl ester carboxylesterase